MERYEEILEYWFEGVNADTNLSGAQEAVRKWFGKSAENSLTAMPLNMAIATTVFSIMVCLTPVS